VPAAIVVAAGMGWAGLALWFDGPASRPLAGTLAAGFVVAALALLIFLRPMRRALGAVLVLWLVVLAWWLGIPARADRDWQSDVARLATAEIHGDAVTVHDVRNFDYRSETDFTEHWEDRSYDLSRLQGADLFISFWGPTLIAHTIMSWEFDDGRHLAVSIETRKEKGEEYSALRGFFRQYELYYVVADERDVVGLRTNYRGERVFLYRLRASPELARRLLLSYLDEINELARTPRWYNALTHNCTTTIRIHARQAQVRNPLDWRLFANGRADELLYERGDINTSLPLAELRAHSNITGKAQAADQDARFSSLIREGLPPRPSAGR
jgi:hypothetical protein